MQQSPLSFIWAFVTRYAIEILTIIGILIVIGVLLYAYYWGKEKYQWSIQEWIYRQDISDLSMYMAVIVMYGSQFLFVIPFFILGYGFISILWFLVLQGGSPLIFFVGEFISWLGGVIIKGEKLPLNIRINEYHAGTRKLRKIHIIQSLVTHSNLVELSAIETKESDDLRKLLSDNDNPLDEAERQEIEKRLKRLDDLTTYAKNNPTIAHLQIHLAYPFYDPISERKMNTLYVKVNRRFGSVDALFHRDPENIRLNWTIKGCRVNVTPFLGSLRCVTREVTSEHLVCTPKDTKQDDILRTEWEDLVLLDESIARPVQADNRRLRMRVEQLEDREIDKFDFALINLGETAELMGLGKKDYPILKTLSKYKWYVYGVIILAIAAGIIAGAWWILTNFTWIPPVQPPVNETLPELLKWLK